MLSKAIRKVKRESDLDRKILAGEELLLRTTQIARFMNLAWILDFIFLLFAILTYLSANYFAVIGIYLPSVLYWLIEPVHASLELDDFEMTYALMGWLLCIFILLVMPIVFDVVLANVCKNASNPEAEVKSAVQNKNLTEKLRYLEDTLTKARHKLFIWPLPSAEMILICVILVVIVAVCTYRTFIYLDVIPDVWRAIFDFICFSLLGIGLIKLLFYLKEEVRNFIFASEKCKKQIDQLFKHFLQEAKKMSPGYRSRHEEWEIKKMREREAAHRSVGYMGFQDDYPHLTYQDHDNLDALQRAMDSGWGKDL